MKYFFFVAFLFIQLSFSDSIYNITIKTIDGNKIELSQFKGKKLLIILLDYSLHDTTVFFKDIIRLQTKYQSSLVVICIPSEETGYKMQDANKLKNIYKAGSANIFITEVMKVKKGTQQVSLFQWLTNKDMNHHFDQDVRGAGSKYFVDEEGELYAVIGKNIALTSPLMDRILGKPLVKKQ